MLLNLSVAYFSQTNCRTEPKDFFLPKLSIKVLTATEHQPALVAAASLMTSLFHGPTCFTFILSAPNFFFFGAHLLITTLQLLKKGHACMSIDDALAVRDGLILIGREFFYNPVLNFTGSVM